jgi:uncharacterized phage-associated protein
MVHFERSPLTRIPYFLPFAGFPPEELVECFAGGYHASVYIWYTGSDLMAKAVEVARFLAYLAANDVEPDYLTNLRLQKLLYYVQAWSLVMRNRPMFEERIEAWVHGPVVREAYYHFKNGDAPILAEDIGEPNFDLDDDDREFIGRVWGSYKGYSALRLREMTHEEDPWINARKGYGPADRCEVEITQQALREYFNDVPDE